MDPAEQNLLIAGLTVVPDRYKMRPVAQRDIKNIDNLPVFAYERNQWSEAIKTQDKEPKTLSYYVMPYIHALPSDDDWKKDREDALKRVFALELAMNREFCTVLTFDGTDDPEAIEDKNPAPKKTRGDRSVKNARRGVGDKSESDPDSVILHDEEDDSHDDDIDVDESVDSSSVSNASGDSALVNENRFFAILTGNQYRKVKRVVLKLGSKFGYVYGLRFADPQTTDRTISVLAHTIISPNAQMNADNVVNFKVDPMHFDWTIDDTAYVVELPDTPIALEETGLPAVSEFSGLFDATTFVTDYVVNEVSRQEHFLSVLSMIESGGTRSGQALLALGYCPLFSRDYTDGDDGVFNDVKQRTELHMFKNEHRFFTLFENTTLPVAFQPLVEEGGRDKPLHDAYKAFVLRFEAVNALCDERVDTAYAEAGRERPDEEPTFEEIQALAEILTGPAEYSKTKAPGTITDAQLGVLRKFPDLALSIEFSLRGRAIRLIKSSGVASAIENEAKGAKGAKNNSDAVSADSNKQISVLASGMVGAYLRLGEIDAFPVYRVTEEDITSKMEAVQLEVDAASAQFKETLVKAANDTDTVQAVLETLNPAVMLGPEKPLVKAEKKRYLRQTTGRFVTALVQSVRLNDTLTGKDEIRFGVNPEEGRDKTNKNERNADLDLVGRFPRTRIEAIATAVLHDSKFRERVAARSGTENPLNSNAIQGAITALHEDTDRIVSLVREQQRDDLEFLTGLVLSAIRNVNASYKLLMNAIELPADNPRFMSNTAWAALAIYSKNYSIEGIKHLYGRNLGSKKQQKSANAYFDAIQEDIRAEIARYTQLVEQEKNPGLVREKRGTKPEKRSDALIEEAFASGGKLAKKMTDDAIANAKDVLRMIVQDELELTASIKPNPAVAISSNPNFVDTVFVRVIELVNAGLYLLVAGTKEKEVLTKNMIYDAVSIPNLMKRIRAWAAATDEKAKKDLEAADVTAFARSLAGFIVDDGEVSLSESVRKRKKEERRAKKAKKKPEALDLAGEQPVTPGDAATPAQKAAQSSPRNQKTNKPVVRMNIDAEDAAPAAPSEPPKKRVVPERINTIPAAPRAAPVGLADLEDELANEEGDSAPALVTPSRDESEQDPEQEEVDVAVSPADPTPYRAPAAKPAKVAGDGGKEKILSKKERLLHYYNGLLESKHVKAAEKNPRGGKAAQENHKKREMEKLKVIGLITAARTKVDGLTAAQVRNADVNADLMAVSQAVFDLIPEPAEPSSVSGGEKSVEESERESLISERDELLSELRKPDDSSGVADPAAPRNARATPEKPPKVVTPRGGEAAMTALKQENAGLLAHVAVLELEIDSHKQNIASLNSSKNVTEEVRKQAAAAQRQNEELKAQLAAVEKLKDDAARFMDEQLAHKQQEVVKLEGDARQARESASAKDKEIQQLKAAMTALQASKNVDQDVQDESTRVKAENDKLKAANHKLDDEKKQLELQLYEKELELQSCKQEDDDKSKQLAAAFKDRNGFRNSLLKRVAEDPEGTFDNAELRADLDAYRRQYKVVFKVSKAERLLREQVAQQERQIGDKDDEITRLNNVIADLNARITNLQDSNRNLKTDLETLSKKASSGSANQGDQASINDFKALIRMLEGDLDTVTGERDKALLEAQAARIEIAGLRTRIITLEAAAAAAVAAPGVAPLQNAPGLQPAAAAAVPARQVDPLITSRPTPRDVFDALKLSILPDVFTKSTTKLTMDDAIVSTFKTSEPNRPLFRFAEVGSRYSRVYTLENRVFVYRGTVDRAAATVRVVHLYLLDPAVVSHPAGKTTHVSDGSPSGNQELLRDYMYIPTRGEVEVRIPTSESGRRNMVFSYDLTGGNAKTDNFIAAWSKKSVNTQGQNVETAVFLVMHVLKLDDHTATIDGIIAYEYQL